MLDLWLIDCKRFAQSAGPEWDVGKKSVGDYASWPLWARSGSILETCWSLWHPFWVTLAPVGSFLEHLGWTVHVQKLTGAPKVPKRRQRLPTTKIYSPIWRHFGDHFSYIFIFSCKNTRASTGSFFSSIFGSPWSLRGVGSYAIRTRLRSRNTLFCFCSFSKKCSLKGANGVKFGVDFGVCVEISGKKGASKKVSKKAPLPTQTSLYESLFPCREAPGQPPSRAHFSNKKQQFEQQFKQCSKFLQKKWKKTEKRNNNSSKVPNYCRQKWKNMKKTKAGDLTRPGQGPANRLDLWLIGCVLDL